MLLDLTGWHHLLQLNYRVLSWIGSAKCFGFLNHSSSLEVVEGLYKGLAILSTLVATRDQKLAQIGKENIGKLVVYGSDQRHSALQKAAQITGFHPNNIRPIKISKSTLFGLSPDSLRLAILSDIDAGLVSCFLCATVGTASTTAVDPLRPLFDAAREYGLWVHVDAAYAGSACICPEFRHFIDGVEGVESFSLNAHKWFFTTLDCCCLWVEDPDALKKSLSTNPESCWSPFNASGDVHMTHSVVGGDYIIRFCVGASLTEDRHVIFVWEVVWENLDAILTAD